MGLLATRQIEMNEETKSYIKVYEFLASCNQEEKKMLFESGAFNDMIKEKIKEMK